MSVGELALDWPTTRVRLLAEARRVVGDQTAAEDVVQEAVLRGWRRWDTCSSEGARMSWLLTITRREALRWRSRPSFHEASLEDEIEDAPQVFRGSAAESEDVLAQRLDVRSALAALPYADQRLLLLRYEHDLTQEQIARVLRMPEGTVKIRLHRLRVRLRDNLS